MDGAMNGLASLPRRTWWIAACVVVIAHVAILAAMGRMPIAASGEIRLWSMAPSSQQLFDWYTPSHVIHGFLFYALLFLCARRLPIGARFGLALLLECGWEVVENTDFVINRYRDGTASPDYDGDTVLNSVSDVGAMAAGFLLARRLPVWTTVALAVFLELLTLWLVRDNLALNVIMLLVPIEAIKQWQLGAS
jgi:hypothetical protein